MPRVFGYLAQQGADFSVEVFIYLFQRHLTPRSAELQWITVTDWKCKQRITSVKLKALKVL